MKGPSQVYWISESLCILGYYRFAWTIPWLVLINWPKVGFKAVQVFMDGFYSKLHIAPRFWLMLRPREFFSGPRVISHYEETMKQARCASCAVGSFFQTMVWVCHLCKLLDPLERTIMAWTSAGFLSDGCGRSSSSASTKVVRGGRTGCSSLRWRVDLLTQLCTPATNKAVSKVSESYR